MRLRTSLTLGFSSVAVAVAVTVGVASWTATVTRLHEETDRSLLEAATTLHSRLQGEGGPATGGRGGARPDGGDRELQARAVLPSQVIAADGTVTTLPFTAVTLPVSSADIDIAAAQDVRRRFADIDVAGHHYRLLTWGLGRSEGAVQIARETDGDRTVLLQLSAQILLIGLATALLAAAAGLLLARRQTRRLEHLGVATQEVARTGSFDVRVPAEGDDEVANLGRTFNDMLTELSRLRARQERLLGDAGHELRTPLTSLRTNIALLSRFAELAPEARARLLQDLSSESRELSALVEEVLAVARGATDAAPHEPILLGDVARAVVDRARRRTGREITLETDDSCVHGDRAALQRAVWNLLDNAAKFDRSGSAVTVVVREGTVIVDDLGPGVPDGERQAVFDRFHRGADARAVSGSGLGLSIVADVAAAHGGTAALAERPGGGTRAVLRLPVVTDDAGERSG